MSRSALLEVMAFSAILAFATPASAENRLALVIGQSAYRSVPPLLNPANDARAVTQLLTDSGFEVSAASDLSQNDHVEGLPIEEVSRALDLPEGTVKSRLFRGRAMLKQFIERHYPALAPAAPRGEIR